MKLREFIQSTFVEFLVCLLLLVLFSLVVFQFCEWDHQNQVQAIEQLKLENR